MLTAYHIYLHNNQCKSFNKLFQFCQVVIWFRAPGQQDEYSASHFGNIFNCAGLFVNPGD